MPCVGDTNSPEDRGPAGAYNSQQHERGLFEEIAEGGEKLGSGGTVHHAMIAGEGERHPLADGKGVTFHHGLFHGCADGEDGGIGRIDDRAEAVHAHHPEVGHAEGAAGELLGLQLLLLGALGEILSFTADGDEIFRVRVADDGGDEAVLNGDGEGDVNAGVVVDGVARPGTVHRGDGAEGVRGGQDGV